MQNEDEGEIDLVWGIAAISKLIRRTPRQTHHLCSKNKLPVRKVGGRWCAERGKLIEFFKGEAA